MEGYLFGDIMMSVVVVVVVVVVSGLSRGLGHDGDDDDDSVADESLRGVTVLEHIERVDAVETGLRRLVLPTSSI